MQSFDLVKIAVLLATLQGVSALPTKDIPKTQIAARETEYWYPNPWTYPSPSNRPINANGAYGGCNYGGNGANGGSIDISRFTGGAAVNSNGANGGRISVGKREEEEFLFPVYRPTYFPTVSGPISATGANGGYNYGGNGANGGSISIDRREEEAGEFFFPIWRPYQPQVPANGAVNANGANGGTNYYGNGANGGSILVSKREEEAGDFFFPIWRPYYQPQAVPANGAINANGANGGYNYGGDGADGGSISISTRDDDFLLPFPWARPAYYGGNGAISANGANGGYNYFGDGANGGDISVGGARY